MQAVRAVGVDASTLIHYGTGVPSSYGTGVPRYVGALLQGVCSLHPAVHFFLYSYAPIHFPDLPNVTKRVSSSAGFSDLWRNTQMLRMVVQDNPDAFWAPESILPVWGLSGIHTVVTTHDLVHKFAPETQPLRINLRRGFLQKLSARRASLNVAVSATTSRDMLANYGRGADEIVHPICQSQFRRLSREEVHQICGHLNLPSRFWLSVGTLEPRKNVVTLINAYEACLAAGLELPPLVLAGGKGWKDKEILARLERAESRGFLRRLGYVEDRMLPALYSACEVFFMPSRYEGFGMPIIEAQMCGAAVAHGNHGSMLEASGGLGVPMPPDEVGMQRVLEAMHAGEAPLACRLPTDPAIQSHTQAVEKMSIALGLQPVAR